MTDYQLVPTELTAEMVEASGCEGEFKLSPWEQAQKMWEAMLAAAPAVRGEPVAYLRKDQLRKVRRMGPMLGEIADSPRADRVPVYAARGPAEQNPDVTQLVEALSELLRSLCLHAGEDVLGRVKGTWSVEAKEAARAALAAYRKGGDA